MHPKQMKVQSFVWLFDFKVLLISMIVFKMSVNIVRNVLRSLRPVQNGGHYTSPCRQLSHYPVDDLISGLSEDQIMVRHS